MYSSLYDYGLLVYRQHWQPLVQVPAKSTQKPEPNSRTKFYIPNLEGKIPASVPNEKFCLTVCSKPKSREIDNGPFKLMKNIVAQFCLGLLQPAYHYATNTMPCTR